MSTVLVASSTNASTNKLLRIEGEKAATVVPKWGHFQGDMTIAVQFPLAIWFRRLSQVEATIPGMASLCDFVTQFALLIK